MVVSTAAKRVAATAAAALAFAGPLAGTAGATHVIDFANPCSPGVAVTPAPFSDRGAIQATHQPSVDCAAALDIVEGENGRYLPAESVTREQMASFIARALVAAGYTLPAPTDQGFRDIGSSVHRDNINRLAAIGVVRGETPERFNPGGVIWRDQMASFLVRAAAYAYGDFDAQGNPLLLADGALPFADVAPGNVHRDAIAGAYELFGLVLGRSTTVYDPRSPTEREEMASFVVRLGDVTLLNP